MTVKESAIAMNNMISEGQAMEALEKYYAENCQVCEKPTGEVRNGKAAQRKAMQDWFGMIKEHHGGSVGAITANEETKITMVQSATDVTMQNGMRMKMEEVAVQQWNEDGQIIKEDFYYHMGPPPQTS